MPRPRFTLRWLMIAVAIAGVAFWAYHLHLQREHLLGRAKLMRLLAEVESLPRVSPFWSGMSPSVAQQESAREIYYQELAAKYARAARYPWLPVAPDPPEPE